LESTSITLIRESPLCLVAMEAHQLTKMARELKETVQVSSAVVRAFGEGDFASSNAVALEMECRSIPEDVNNLINYDDDVKLSSTSIAQNDKKMNVVVWTRK